MFGGGFSRLGGLMLVYLLDTKSVYDNRWKAIPVMVIVLLWLGDGVVHESSVRVPALIVPLPMVFPS